MAFSLNNKGAKSSAVDPDKTGDLSAAKVASKPTRRSARGSDVAKQQKKDRREKKAREAEAEKARSEIRRERAAIAATRLAADQDRLHAVHDAGSTRKSGAHGSRNERAVAKGAPSKSGRAKASESRGGVFGKVAGAFAAIGKGAGQAKASADPATQHAFLKYANDSALVRAIYQFTAGPQRHLFYLLVAALIAMGVYLPVRDLYIATRTEQILTEQKAIRDKYNESIADQAKQWLSEEGVRDTARKDLGMVMPGETPIEVEGLDEEGNPIVEQVAPADEGAEGQPADGQPTEGDSAAGATQNQPVDEGGVVDGSRGEAEAGQDAAEEDNGMLKGSEATDKSKTGSGAAQYDPRKEPTSSAEVEAAERAVFEHSPWYWKVLDMVFFFDGVNGMAVVSTGE